MPDNVFLNVSCEEYSNCIELVPNAEDFRIIIYGDRDNRRADQFFGKDEAEECYTWLGELTPITAGNVNGYFCSYKSSYNSYAEYRFDGNGKNENNVLGILIHRKNSQEIEEALMHSTVQKLLHSLKTE